MTTGTIEDTSIRLTVTLPCELVEQLRRLARTRQIGVSTLIRMLILASLERPYR